MCWWGGVSLSSINPALATESFNQNNLIGNGSPIQISDTDKLGENTKVIGGIDLSGISSSDIANTNVSITLSKETTIDEVIGGSQARTQKEKDKEALLHIGSSTLEAKNITADRIIGGSKNSNSDKVNLSTDKIKTTLSNVIVKKDFVGGNLLKATGQGGGGPATAEGKTQSIENNILSGEFDGRFVGGSMAENYGNNTGTLKVSDQSIVTNVSGGDFSKIGQFIAGSFASGSHTSATVDSTVLKITGGTFYSETAGKRNWIYAGSGAENGGVVSHKNSTLILDGSQNGFTPLQGTTQNQTHGQFFGGGLNATVSNSVNVSVENIIVGLIDSKNEVKTSHIYAGSNIKTSGTFNEGNTNLNVKNSHFFGDALGAGFVMGNDVTFRSGDAVVYIVDSTFDGYTQSTNRYSGRVFGAGRVEAATNANVIVNSSTVRIHNISGRDLETGISGVSHDPGTQVFGGMQVYAAKNSLAHVNSTNVFVDGEKTALAEVYGGGIVSGTVTSDKSSTLSAGTTYVEWIFLKLM